ncbi:hypothetical protein M2475_000830 [Breznakia sp. PF5-3]|uniref:DUF4357 domain-containing protein n=1 Tax=unclassified Breznakia TaxID=2623764 RepID=UPI002405F9A3|nr:MULTISPECIES: DUF4357 domain-containing protein [unclassified Breznakia]MDF9824452.1 hypothetical protein [Breznakia sp. PM6-1]MDF9835265.1 hypothetical protein [Breznakia sp. PF5-3]MDF9837407.1 hypothetical protein [Breznakia sp. PFB2-8]MDF9859342.1 hypothetical protein [Breznakia sp. PH5-24]
MESNPRKLLDEFIPEAMGKQFVIPVYQRKYTWTVKKQLVQLMKDLLDLINDETKQKQHFLGTVVYLENVVEYKTERSIVDGQQRLVTMFLIAHAMKSIADNEYRSREIDETYLQNFAESEGSRYRQRLYPSVADGNDYLIIAESRYDEIDNNNRSNIVQNFLYLQEELKKLVEEYTFDRVLYALKRFSIVYIKLDDRDNAQQIFESINSTGERLTASDLIRNFIMMDKSNEEQTILYNKYWRRLEEIFDNSKGMEDFFRYYLAAITGEYSAKHVLYQAFKNYWHEESNLSTDAELLQKLVRYSDYFDKLYYQAPAGKYAEILSDFQNMESMMPAPFVLGLSEWYYHDEKITEDQFYSVIKIVNNYQIRRYFNGDDTSRVSKAFPSYLKNVRKYAEVNGFDNIADIVIYVLVTRNQSNNMALPSDKALKSNLINANAYSMRLLRWLLEKIENRDNSAKLDMNNLSIEHIMPQTSTPYWEEKAGVNGEEYTGLVNTIGNLTLVTKPDNSAAGNKDFETKKKIFEDTLHIHMNKNLYDMDEWTFNTILKRSNNFVDELIEMYPYLRSETDYNDGGNRIIFLEAQGIKATGYLNEDETVVIYSGSEIYSKIKDIGSDSLGETRQELLDNGIIEETIGGLQFAQDYIASSVSNAADLLLGGSRNGWTYWKDENGKSIDELFRKNGRQ